MNLHTQKKFLIPGSLPPVVQEVIVFGETAIWKAISFCVTLCSLSLALSHCPKLFGFIVFSRMVVGTLL